MARSKGRLVVKNQADATTELQRAMRRKLQLTLTEKDWEPIALGIIERMKALITKGISPIQGNGRFPGYKWVTRLFSNRQSLKVLRRLERSKKDKVKGARVRSAIKSRREQNEDIKRSKYPYNQTDEFPSKRIRPVNLTLSGDFLSNLTWRWDRKTGVDIGYFDELSAKKEQGHREGVNSQPKRPTIPRRSEKLNAVVQLSWTRALDRLFKRKLKSNRT